jgi:hypothetical protein
MACTCSVAALGALAISSAARACPTCHTELGAAVRAAILGPDFGVHLLALVSPILILAGIVAGLQATCSKLDRKRLPSAQLPESDARHPPERPGRAR